VAGPARCLPPLDTKPDDQCGDRETHRVHSQSLVSAEQADHHTAASETDQLPGLAAHLTNGLADLIAVISQHIRQDRGLSRREWRVQQLH
jgi:hypothetical protein